MAKKYLDSNGLSHFWTKIKAYIASVLPVASSTTPEMDGTATTGSETAFAKGDHIHPTDTSRAPTSHASSGTTYGKGTNGNYGHVKLSDATAGTEAAASGGTAATPKAVKDALDAAKSYADGLDTGVSDVTVDGTSVVTGGVAAVNGKATGNSRIFYGTCSTAGAAVTKVVECSSYDALTVGDILVVTFSSRNAISSPMLNVNSKGAKVIRAMYRGEISSLRNLGSVQGTCIFVYDGTYWLLQHANDDAEYTLATTSSHGLMSASDKTKLDGIASGAEVNRTYTPVTGKPTADEVPTFGSSFYVSQVSQDATGQISVVDREIIIPSRLATSSLKGLMSYTDKQKLDKLVFDANNLIDSSILPSYVDDVVEAYPRSGATELSSAWLSLTSGGSALTPETGKIYVLMADSTSYAANTQFRWSGSAYVKLADGGVSEITTAEIDTIVAS